MNLIVDFFNGRESLKYINSTFITLIPNFKEAAKIRDFHPMLGLNTIYKLISKIIANSMLKWF